MQEALEKMDRLPGLEWHLIGALQSNKTRAVAERFDWVHTVERVRIASRLSDQRPAHLPPLNVLIQVNVSAEASKSGVHADALAGLAAELVTLPRLRLRGLMAIPAPGAAQQFTRMKRLFDELATSHGFDTLSMGMSDDLEHAIAAGATLVRVGTAIFGERAKEESAA